MQAVQQEGDGAVRVLPGAHLVTGVADALQDHHDGAGPHVVADGAFPGSRGQQVGYGPVEFPAAVGEDRAGGSGAEGACSP